MFKSKKKCNLKIKDFGLISNFEWTEIISRMSFGPLFKRWLYNNLNVKTSQDIKTVDHLDDILTS